MNGISPTLDFCSQPEARWTKNRTRKKIDINDNETPSFVPTIFLKGISGPITGNNLLPWDPSYFQYRAWQKKIEPDVADHFELRIQLFFQQLLLSYKTHLRFFQFQTSLQVGITDGKGSGGLDEAHSSTLPSLSFISQEVYHDHFISGNSTLNAKKFAAHSSFEKSGNSTAKLPPFVNTVDSLLDEQTKGQCIGGLSFRNYCITILNYNSSGDLNPCKGLIRFLNSLLNLIEEIYKNNSLFDEQDFVLNSYSEVLVHYLQLNDSNPQEFFRKLSFGALTGDGEDQKYELTRLQLTIKMRAEKKLWLQLSKIESAVRLILQLKNKSPIKNFVKSFLLLMGASFCENKASSIKARLWDVLLLNHQKLIIKNAELNLEKRRASLEIQQSELEELQVNLEEHEKKLPPKGVDSNHILWRQANDLFGKTIAKKRKIEEIYNTYEIEKTSNEELKRSRASCLRSITMGPQRREELITKTQAACLKEGTKSNFLALEQFFNLNYSWAAKVFEIKDKHTPRALECLESEQFREECKIFFDLLNKHKNEFVIE